MSVIACLCSVFPTEKTMSKKTDNIDKDTDIVNLDDYDFDDMDPDIDKDNESYEIDLGSSDFEFSDDIRDDISKDTKKGLHQVGPDLPIAAERTVADCIRANTALMSTENKEDLRQLYEHSAVMKRTIDRINKNEKMDIITFKSDIEHVNIEPRDMDRTNYRYNIYDKKATLVRICTKLLGKYIKLLQVPQEDTVGERIIERINKVLYPALVTGFGHIVYYTTFSDISLAGTYIERVGNIMIHLLDCFERMDSNYMNRNPVKRMINTYEVLANEFKAGLDDKNKLG